jgi:hypothetical protein
MCPWESAFMLAVGLAITPPLPSAATARRATAQSLRERVDHFLAPVGALDDAHLNTANKADTWPTAVATMARIADVPGIPPP